MKRPSFLRRNSAARRQMGPEQPQNAYYENISARFGIAQVMLYLALFAFVVLSFLGNTQLITYENFYYFFQDLNSGVGDRGLQVQELSYPTDEEQSFASYRGGLAVAGNQAVTIFSATGRQALSVTVNYRHPVAVGTGKYLLVYEQGGRNYSLYNSTVQIHSGLSDQPIYSAAVSDSGMYALVSSSNTHASVVSLYSSRFALINRYNRTGYVTDVALSADGGRVAMLVSDAAEGGAVTSLLLAKPGEKELIAETAVGGSWGLSCAFSDSGTAIVLCRDGIRFFSEKGSLVGEYDFSGMEPEAADLGGDGAVTLLKKNGVSEKKVVIVFDKDGKIVYNEVVSGEIRQPKLCEDAAFWLTGEGVCRLSLKTGATVTRSVSTDHRTLLALSKNTVLLCSAQKAAYLDFPD